MRFLIFTEGKRYLFLNVGIITQGGGFKNRKMQKTAGKYL